MKYLTIIEQKTLERTVWETKGAERDAVMIDLFLNTGLRVSEMAGLLVGDVRGKQRLFVRSEIAKRMRRINPDGKPREKGRFVPLHVKAQDLVHTWIRMKLERRERIALTDAGGSPAGDNMSDSSSSFPRPSGRGAGGEGGSCGCSDSHACGHAGTFKIHFCAILAAGIHQTVCDIGRIEAPANCARHGCGRLTSLPLAGIEAAGMRPAGRR